MSVVEINDYERLGAKRVEEPPEPIHSGGIKVWDERIEFVVSDPGEWYEFGPYASSSIVRTVNNAVARSEAKGEFDITTRKTGDKEHHVYVKYREEE